jgi:hypothetical protein
MEVVGLVGLNEGVGLSDLEADRRVGGAVRVVVAGVALLEGNVPAV